MSRLVVHVDTAATWRGGQNQVVLTAQGMAARGVRTEIVCRGGGELEARARAAGLVVLPVPFRGDLWPPGILALDRLLRQAPRSVLLLHDPHAVSAGLEVGSQAAEIIMIELGVETLADVATPVRDVLEGNTHIGSVEERVGPGCFRHLL